MACLPRRGGGLWSIGLQKVRAARFGARPVLPPTESFILTMDLASVPHIDSKNG